MNVLAGGPILGIGKVAQYGLGCAWRRCRSALNVNVSRGSSGQSGFGNSNVAKGVVCLSSSSGLPSVNYPNPEERENTKRAPRICILGGGFGGLYTAIKLESLMWPEGRKPMVTLIDQNNNFVFKPMLYELVNGEAQDWEIAPCFVDLLEPYPTTFIKGRVTGVQPGDVTKDGGSSKGGCVMLDDGSSIEYDWLVLALGAEPNTRNVPGVKDYTIPFSTFEDAEKVRESLAKIEASGTPGNVVVIGGGYAGVELAAVVAEKLRKTSGRVTLVTDLNEILATSPDLQRAAAKDVLAETGVEVRAGYYVEKVEPLKSKEHAVNVILTPASAPGSSREKLPADVAMWTAGSRPVTGNDASKKPIPFPKNRFGAIQTDSTLQVVNHTRVFALGDTSSQDVDVANFPATAQVAFQQADYVAWNLWASINGRALLSFRYQHLGDMMSLGSSQAAVAMPFALPEQISQTPLKPVMDAFGIKLGDDSSQKLTLQGPLAGLVRRAAYWYRQPTNEHRNRVGASWLRKGVSDASKWVERNKSGKK